MMGFEPIPRFSRERILSPLRLPFRHIGLQANLTRGLAQTKRFSIYDQLPQRSRNFFDSRQLTDANKIQREEIFMGKLDGKKVAILVTDGFEQVEMTKPREALEEAGAETKIVSPKSGQILGMNHANKGDKFDVDIPLDEARPEEFDALMIPGGLMNPDELRATPDALEFTKHFFPGRQTSGRNLSRALGVDRRRCRSWTQTNVVGAHPDRCEKCRWQLKEGCPACRSTG